MRSNTGKHPRATFVILASCFGLLAAALILDFFWASSSSSSTTTIASVATYTNAATNWDLEEPIWSEKAAAEYKKFDHLITTNTTFGDLPGPELQWEEMEEAPVPRLDGAAIQIDDLFYVFAGFGTLDHVHSHVDVYNFKENKWTEKFEMPKEMANSHLGMATDGRYIYAITGQYGAQCSTPTARTFVLDTKTRK